MKTGENRRPANIRPCPFCGETLRHGKEPNFVHIMFHPGVVTDADDGGCILSGKGLQPHELYAWNRRAAQAMWAKDLDERWVDAIKNADLSHLTTFKDR